MNNIVVVSDRWARVDLAPRLDYYGGETLEDGNGSHGGLETVVAVTASQEHGVVYAVTNMCNIYGVQPIENKVLFEFSLLHSGALPAVQSAVAMEYIPEQEALFLAMAEGDLLLVHPASQEVESVGALEGGLAGAAWAPDGEAVVLVTRRGRLLLMTSGWDVLAEVDLEQEAGAPGGGSRKADGLEELSASDLLPPGSVQISWRGDAKYFTTSSPRMSATSATEAGRPIRERHIRVWERDGAVLHSCAEPAPSLHRPVAWRPSGALIVAASTVGDLDAATCHQIMLYERNGLKRGSFPLVAPADADVAEIEWSSDSELLGLVVRSSQWDAVQVWHRSNYHWYLKAEWRWEPIECVHLAWDAEKPLRLLCWTGTGVMRSVDMVWDSAVGYRSTATVIDGSDLRITPLGRTLIPPPMAAQILRFRAPILAVSGRCQLGIGPESTEGGKSAAMEGQDEALAVVLSDGSITVVGCAQKDGWEDLSEDTLTLVSPESVKTSITENGESYFSIDSVRCQGDEQSLGTGLARARQLAWLDSKSLLAVVSTQSGAADISAGEHEGPPAGGLEDSPAGDALVELELLFGDLLQLTEGASGSQSERSKKRPVVQSLRVAKITPLSDRVVRVIHNPKVQAGSASQEGAGSLGIGLELGLGLETNETLGDEGGTQMGRGRPGGGSALVQLSSGLVLEYLPGLGLNQDPETAKGSSSFLASVRTNHTLPDGQKLTPGFPQPCPWMAVHWLGAPKQEYAHSTQQIPLSSSLDREPLGLQSKAPKATASLLKSPGPSERLLVGLTEHGRLYVNSHLAANDCTSFVIHAPSEPGVTQQGLPGAVHLAYTTRQNVLHVVPISGQDFGHLQSAETVSINNQSGASNEHAGLANGRAPGKGRKKEKDDLHVQPVWELGAKLIAALGEGQVAVILQTSRGSLETLYPRALVLSAVGFHLQGLEFDKALYLSRRHRLDLNVLVDYGGWPSFVAHAKEFVRRVKNLAHITELVCSLKQSNVCETVYQGLMPDLDPSSNPANDGAVLEAGGSSAPGGSARFDDASSASAAQGNGVAAAVSHEPQDLSVVGTTGQGGSEVKAPGGNKIEAVCAALREVLETEVPPGRAREMCILTTLAKSDPPLIEEALHRVKAARDKELQEKGELAQDEIGATSGEAEEDEAAAQALLPVKSEQPITAEAALRHLMWLADPGKVFNVALGLYDLPLAAMVAAQSQLDPQEFVPFLTELEQMPTLLMRYTIDRRLGRLESALRHLAKAGPQHFPAVVELLVANPGLFPIGAEVLEGTGGRRAQVMEAWGEHLAREEKFEDAAAAFCAGAVSAQAGSPRTNELLTGGSATTSELRAAEGETPGSPSSDQLLPGGDSSSTVAQAPATDQERDQRASAEGSSEEPSRKSLLERALAAYRAGGHWRSAFIIAGRLGYSSDLISSLAGEVREELVAMERPAEAAIVAIEYGGDVEGGVGLLVEGRQWRQAARTAYAHGRGDLVDSVVGPAALECARSQIAQLEEASEKVGSYLARYEGLRQRRVLLAAKVEEAQREGWGEAPEEDAASEASSAVSGMSLYTRGGTSKAPSVASSKATTATTTGGKRVSRRAARKAAMGGGRIRAGSPGEEQALLEHLRCLGPTARLKEEVGQLLEILLIFGQELLARQLQQRLDALVRSHLAAMERTDAAVAADVAAQEAVMATGSLGLTQQRKKTSPGATMKAQALPVRWKWAILEPASQEAAARSRNRFSR